MKRNWQASFISPSASSGNPGDPAPYLRRDFVIGEGLQQATLYVTALGLVEPWLNGTRLGDEVLAPGWTSYRHRLVVSSYDVTTLVSEGDNTVGAVLGEGWAVGRIGFEGDRRHHWSDRRALFAELELSYGDRREVIGTDTGWRAGTGGGLSDSIYDGETFDARLEPAGWSSASFDDSSWGPVARFEWDRGTLVEPISPPIRRTQELAVEAVLTTPSGRTVVDFGQNISGWVRLRVDGPAGTVVTLRHGEVMVDGELDFSTNRTAQATDRYTLSGGGPETWEPRFTFHGFRYVDVDGWPGELDPAAATAVVVHTDMTRTGWFDSSHELLNRLHANVVWSMRDNFVGVPTDCPQRDERLGWTGDINAFGPTAAFLHDVRGVLGSWLADLAAEQVEKGFVPWVVPDMQSYPSAPTALWSDVAVSLPWTLYQEYGDVDILRTAYPSMTAFVDQVEALLDEHGLWSSGFQFGDWLDPDAPADNPMDGKTDRYLVAAAYFARVTEQMRLTAELLDKADDAARYGALAARVRDAFRAEYVTARGRLVNETATGYALAICFDLLDPDQEQRAGERLATLVAAASYTIATGFAGTPLVTDALSRTGHLDEAYRMLLQEQCPSFLYPVTMGATTIWERWDSIRPDGTVNPSGMTSLNHYALGAVADWLHRVVAGLAAAAPGWSRLRIAPHPGGGLTSAGARHLTPHGPAEVSWWIDHREIRLDVLVPEGTQAVVVLPLDVQARTLTVEAGRHSWSYDLPDGWGQFADIEISMDTSLAVLAVDPIWDSLATIFARHLPGIPIDGTSPEAAALSLNTLLELIPLDTQGLRDDLVATITSTTNDKDLP